MAESSSGLSSRLVCPGARRSRAVAGLAWLGGGKSNARRSARPHSSPSRRRLAVLRAAATRSVSSSLAFVSRAASASSKAGASFASAASSSVSAWRGVWGAERGARFGARSRCCSQRHSPLTSRRSKVSWIAGSSGQGSARQTEQKIFAPRVFMARAPLRATGDAKRRANSPWSADRRGIARRWTVRLAVYDPTDLEMLAVEVEINGVSVLAENRDRLAHEGGIAEAGHDASPAVMIIGARSVGQIGGPASESHLRVTRAKYPHIRHSHRASRVVCFLRQSGSLTDTDRRGE